MRSRIWLAVLGSLMAQAAGAATLPARAPGLWQSVSTVRGPDGKVLPNADNVVTVSCVDADNDAKFFTSGESACTDLRISGAGQHFAINGACRGQGQYMTIHETLFYASPQDVQLQAQLKLPSGPITIAAQLRWQGACLPGMMPGDEGNIVNGTFSKADNINDPANQ
ncbi:DUF3617 domain-containing protein [Acidocella sp.]|jgi:hypothetical protein|uniref:DUF3617 domain-containing protein n=1 Tax=Acidocella sp. TaxID=50710 RepID=UPI002F42A8EB